YETKAAHTKVIAPLWQWPPFDLVAELVPIHWKDSRTLHYRLTPATTSAADPETMLSRAEQLRIKLRSSVYTRLPATLPATTQSTQPATTQSTQPATTQTTQPAILPATQPAAPAPTTQPTTRSGKFL